MRNWAGNLEYAARAVHEPTSIEELCTLVRSTPRVRPIGTRHSFSDVADTPHDLVSVGQLPRRLELDREGRRVTVSAAMRYGELGPELDAAGFALANLASLPHISVAGSVATGTHGSGMRLASLASEVVGLELVTGDGELRTLSREDDPATFPGAVVALGALGVVTAVTLAVEPAYRMRQDVYDDLPFDAALDGLDEILGAAGSVSLFTTWRGTTIDQVWVKRRLPIPPGAAPEVPLEVGGATLAPEPRHPIPGLPTSATTEQLGVAGPWFDRLPHFRLGHTPSSGDELQAEWLVPRDAGPDALRALHGIRDQLGPLVQTSEIRTVAADDLWLSPSSGRDSLAVHLTLAPDGAAVASLLPRVDAALEPFEPRPHWGKLSSMAPERIVARYPRFRDFAALADELDPSGRFRNGYVQRLFDAAAASE